MQFVGRKEGEELIVSPANGTETTSFSRSPKLESDFKDLLKIIAEPRTSDSAMPTDTTRPTESFCLPHECENQVSGIRDRIRGRAERCPIPSTGFIIDFPSVYGCDHLAEQTIENATKLSSTTIDPHIAAYTWKILVFFPGSPTIGNTFTALIPFLVIGDITMQIQDNNGHSSVLKLAGHCHLFHKECTLEVKGNGRLAALVIVPNGY